jgi:YidC/Oxa1 family membrane protein insertase
MTELSKAIGWVLAVYYSLIPNLGVAIILLTCTVMLVLFPLTAKQARSMIAMQRVQPEIKKIQQRYKDDKQKQNEEIMKFYQENKINPLSGCFPLLMQMPIFFALFELLKHTQGRVPKTGQFSQLFQDVCPHATAANKYACPHPQGLHFLSMNLSISPAKAHTVTSGFLGTLPYFILVALVMLTGWYQTKQTMARTANQGPQTGMAAQTQMIGKVMPIAFGLISLNFAAGLVLYFVTSNAWRIGQQHLVLNKIYEQEQAKSGPKAKFADDAIDVDAEEKDAPPKGKDPDGKGTGGARGGTTPKPPAGSGNGSGKGTGGRVVPGAAGGASARARPNPNTAQRKRKRKR